MAIQTKPNIQIPFSETGNKQEFSETKLRQGWISEIPKAENENFLQNRQDTALIHIFQTGIAQWDAITPYTAGKSYVQGSNGNIYAAVTDSINQNPTSTTAWRLLIDRSSKLANETRTISTGNGLQGGGDLSSNRTLSLAPSGVSPGTYGSSGSVASIQVDATGRVVSAQNQAIDFASAFTPNSLQIQGYQTLPNGLILQWGRFDQAGQSVVNQSFNTPFPNSALMVMVSKGSQINLASEPAVGADTLSRTQFRCAVSAPTNQNYGITWFAIGF